MRPLKQGVKPNLNSNRKLEWTVLFWWTQTELEPANFYFSEPEPNLNLQNCAQVNPNRTWTPNKSKNIFFHIRMPLLLVHAGLVARHNAHCLVLTADRSKIHPFKSMVKLLHTRNFKQPL